MTNTSKPRTRKSSQPAPAAQPSQADIIAAELEAIVSDAVETASVEKRTAKTIEDVKLERFHGSVDGMIRQGQRILNLGEIAGHPRAIAEGGTLWKMIVKQDGSTIYCHDDVVRGKMGSVGHFTRCVQLAQLDGPDLRTSWLGSKQGLDTKRYIQYLQVMTSGVLTDDQVKAGWSLTFQSDGVTPLGATIKAPATQRGGKDDEQSSESVTAPVTIHPALAALAAADDAAVDAIVEAGAAMLAAIAPGKWDSVAELFAAAIIQRDRVAAPAADDDVANLAAAAAQMAG